jgi:leucyl aminopeptidase
VAEIIVTAADLAAASTDAVLVTTFEDGLSKAVLQADAALGGPIGEMKAAREFTGKFAQRPVLRTLGRLGARRLMLLGLGKPAQLDSYRLHNAFWLAGGALRLAGVRSVTVVADPAIAAALDGGHGPARGDDVVRAAVTGLLLGNWDGGVTKTVDEDGTRDKLIERIELSGFAGDDVAATVAEAQVLASATNQVRTWVTTPSNRLTPTELAAQAERLFQGTGLEVEVLRKADLERLGMGALLGVAQGSEEPPVMICVRWDGGRPGQPRLGLVGKGITFDTGGISIKPAGGMEMMKTDMGGGGAVLGAMWAIATLQIPANVVGIVPATENMPGGRAYKPGDVLTSRSGKTIEVLNTDAEGRIILADGLAQAREMGATHLVDVATLTGAVIVALGHATTGLMTNDARLGALVEQAAARAGDRVSELPMFPEYDVCLESQVADVANIGASRAAGSISAAVFLREFVGDLPWVHLDIAGTSWNDQGELKMVPSGPSGTPVRTFVHLARAFASLPDAGEVGIGSAGQEGVVERWRADLDGEAAGAGEE